MQKWTKNYPLPALDAPIQVVDINFTYLFWSQFGADICASPFRCVRSGRRFVSSWKAFIGTRWWRAGRTQRTIYQDFVVFDRNLNWTIKEHEIFLLNVARECVRVVCVLCAVRRHICSIQCDLVPRSQCRKSLVRRTIAVVASDTHTQAHLSNTPAIHAICVRTNYFGFSSERGIEKVLV